MPYFTCQTCRLTYYTAASRVYAPECPHCYEPTQPGTQVLARVIPLPQQLRRGSSESRPNRPRA